jgi:hypothetical protein
MAETISAALDGRGLGWAIMGLVCSIQERATPAVKPIHDFSIARRDRVVMMGFS